VAILSVRVTAHPFGLTRLLATQAFVTRHSIEGDYSPSELGTCALRVGCNCLLPVISTLTRLPYNQITHPAPMLSCVAAPRQLIRRLSRRPLLPFGLAQGRLGVSLHFVQGKLSTSSHSAWSPAPVPIMKAIPRPLAIG
jgi:hypothetical protein